MDKETLALVISALTEMEIIELYKIKKINNFGFRANTIEDVRKNRQILENNLLKPINIKHIQRCFVYKAANLEINIEGLQWSELIELCKSEGYSKVLIALYVNGKRQELKKIVSEYLEKSSEEHLDSTSETEKVDSVSENKINKTIKKLEIKLKNITEEFQKKEYNYKLELENKNKLAIDLRKENMCLKQELNKVNIENNQYKQENNLLKNENINLKDLNNKLQQQNENYSIELKNLIEEVTILKEEISKSENNTQISTNNQSIDIKVVNTTTSYEIAVLGEYNELILNNISGVHFEFIQGEAIKEFSIEDNSTKYNEIWIIHYDLTQKEKRIVHMKNFENNIEIKIKNIYNLKELKQEMINLKNNDRVI